MAWNNSIDGNKILTIDEMNSSKSYNIFNYSSNKCPTKKELLDTYVISDGYKYTVSINGNYDDNQLVPNKSLSVKAEAQTYSIYVQVNMTIEGYTIREETAQNYWNFDYHDGTATFYSYDCDCEIYLLTGGVEFHSVNIKCPFTGEVVEGDRWVTGIHGGVTYKFTNLPSNISVDGVKVYLYNNCDGFGEYYPTQSEQNNPNGRTYTIDIPHAYYTGPE